jgi:2-methylisocitrate lyase-like PEP mutase family enzyme
MPRSTAEKRATFRALHDEGCFVLPNPWDIGSARYLESLGFKALATTSAGFAWTLGQPDNGVTLDQVLAHLRDMASATDLPLNADFENGFAHDPAELAHNVRLALDTGIAGLSIEDATGDAANPIYPLDVAIARIEAARRAFDEAGNDALLIGRAENFLHGRNDLRDTIARLVAYRDAGADCLYAPGLKTREQIAEAVAAVAPAPLNLLVSSATDLTFDDIARLGVRRISVGSALARTVWGEFMRVAQLLAGGSFDGFAKAASNPQLDAFFSGKR